MEYNRNIVPERRFILMLGIHNKVNLVEHAANVDLEGVLIQPCQSAHGKLPKRNTRRAKAIRSDVWRVNHQADQSDELKTLLPLIALPKDVINEVEVLQPRLSLLVLLYLLDHVVLKHVSTHKETNIERNHTG